MDGEGHHPIAAWASSDAERGESLIAIAERYPEDPRASIGVPNVIRTGMSEFYPEVLPEHLERGARDETHRELLERTGAHSAIVAPIASRGRSLGAMTVVRFGGGRRYDTEDVALLEELGRRMGAWLDTAQLYAERSYIAKTLQESLLPAQLPEIPGIAHGGALPRQRRGQRGRRRLLRPVPGQRRELVGGGGRRVRQGARRGRGDRPRALHAPRRRHDRPGAQRRACGPSTRRSCASATTCASPPWSYVSLAPENGGMHVDIASAGHPLPLVLRADGTVEPVGSEGTLVGVVPDPDLHDDSAQLEQGDSLVLYTDGVTEARDDTGQLGEGRLRDILGSCAGMDADAIAATIEAAAVDMQPGGTRDDIAVVVLKAAGNVGKAAKNG